MSIDAAARPGPRPGVFDRMTQILDVFFTHEGRLLLDDVSLATGLPRSTTFRMLSQLVELHWLEHTDRGYRTGVRARALRAPDSEELRCAAAPVLNELHLRTRAVAHLSVLEGPVVRYLDKIGGAASSSMPSRVGARLSPDRTVSGKCLLAELPPEDVDTLLTIEAGRERSTAQLAELHRELDQIRTRRGLAIDAAEQCGMGITAVAAPVHGSRGLVGSISLASRDGAPARDLAPLVVVAARTVSRTLGFVPRSSRHAAPV
ncbi:IclR family transcriptional regulator [Nocardioides sp. YIM 152315]|uniref:IclR family transcriptional regulator n=1 Tax=Nocardioides sp. YIM 152315 TaxID=3031760 RepID=UPI0023DC2272|nr:IclR family transcriptional regulator [Nocardioides sp. YIM 152315]MDF1604656.1 IclR family transcriptional regulator [Nocardioides sp. YIM 152315]